MIFSRQLYDTVNHSLNCGLLTFVDLHSSYKVTG